MTAALGLAAIGTTPIVPATAVDTDYHAEGQTIAGNISIQTDRAPNHGTAVATCDPDPRPDPHVRPDDCAWGVPVGTGRDLVNFGRHIPDADFSPDGAFTPVGSATRENFNGKAGFDTNAGIFVGDFFDDDDMHFRLTPRTLDAYLAPNGDPNNRWRRFCGTGVIDQFNNSGQGGAPSHPPLAPFAAGQLRKFVVEVWDADLRDPSDQDGGNQDYWVIDILKPGSLFDTSRCQPDVNQPQQPPVQQPVEQPSQPTPNPLPNQQPAPTVGVPAPAAGTPTAATATGGSRPPIVVASSTAPSLVLEGSAGVSAARQTCVATAIKAAVAGHNITHVDFFFGGVRLARVFRRDASGSFRVRILLRGVKPSEHRVQARLAFTAASHVRARALQVTVRVCPRGTKPAFTG